MNLLRGIQTMEREAKIKGALRFFILVISVYWLASMVLNTPNFDILNMDLMSAAFGTVVVGTATYMFTALLNFKQMMALSVGAFLFGIYLTLRNLQLIKNFLILIFYGRKN